MKSFLEVLGKRGKKFSIEEGKSLRDKKRRHTF